MKHLPEPIGKGVVFPQESRSTCSPSTNGDQLIGTPVYLPGVFWRAFGDYVLFWPVRNGEERKDKPPKSGLSPYIGSQLLDNSPPETHSKQRDLGGHRNALADELLNQR